MTARMGGTVTRPSPGEQSLWLLHQLVPDRGVANVAVYVESAAPVRWWPLREAFQWLVDRHPALRSSYAVDGGEPVKLVAAPGSVEVDIELMHTTDTEREEALTGFAGRPFDVTEAPLARLGVQTVDGAATRICLAAAHLVVDAASVDLLLAELRAAFTSFSGTGEAPDLPPPAPDAPPAVPRPESLRYWHERLAGYRTGTMRLATARDLDGSPTFAAGEIVHRFPDAVGDTVSALRKRCRSTEAAVLLAAYLLALRAQGAGTDCVVGVMVNNRAAATAAVGYHVSTLPLRIGIDPDGGFAALVTAAGRALLDAVQYADVSFEHLAPDLSEADADPLWWRTGLVRQTFNYRLPLPGGPATDVEPVRDVHTGLSRFEVELTLERAFGGLFARLSYSTEVHDEAFATALMERITGALEQATADPHGPVGDLDLRTAAERALADRVNGTGVRWPGQRSVPGLVAEAVRLTPDAPAVVEGDRTVSYGDLAGLAAGVAGALRDAGVVPGEVVALGGPRGIDLVAAVLGTWAAGAAYLPLDPGHPAARLTGQLDDSGCRVVLDGHLLPQPCRAGRTVLAVAGIAPADLEPLDADPASLAYLIYTSGSTGEPKGVRLTHGNLANVVRHFAGLVDADAPTVMLWLTTFAFDISALELCLPLVCGGTVVVAPDDVRAAPERLLDLVERTGTSLIQATPTTWRMLLPVAGERLADRVALCGGEPMPPALARRLRAATRRAYNVYGPTETTIWSTAVEVTSDQETRVTVGTPIANTGAHVLDARLRPVPPLVTGELCLSGDGVADGYHRRPDLTADRFRTDPATGRFYRTGDLARQLADGQIELLGRRDRQVKLRGHRIELGEVEQVIADHPGVAAASVVVGGDPSGADGHLVAFVVPHANGADADSVWELARDRLPAYCVPGRVVVLPDLPQTPNGKVDVAALMRVTPACDAGRPGAGATAASPAEAALVRAWREVLDRPADRDTNFFLGGGTSLIAVRLAGIAAERLDTPVTMGMIFRAPTPAALAALVSGAGPS